MHMVDLLVRDAAVILQHVVVFRSSGCGDFLRDGQEFGERVVGDVG